MYASVNKLESIVLVCLLSNQPYSLLLMCILVVYGLCRYSGDGCDY